jgi:hypothetical protein
MKLEATIRRLKLGIATLERAIAEERPFSIRWWRLDRANVFDTSVVSGREDHPCGTVCCAVGLMMEDPAHHRQGLRERDNWPAFGRRGVGFESVAAYFGITHDEAMNLFHSERYRDDDKVKLPTVLNKLKRFTRAKEKALKQMRQQQADAAESAQ